MATLGRDPRDVITPEAFRVADHLIGVPLARPSRRLAAFLIDLLLVAVLVGLKSAWAFVLALLGAFLVFRLSRSKVEGRWYKRFYRRGLGCFGALLTFILLSFAVDTIRDFFSDGDNDDDMAATVTTDSGSVKIEGLGVLASAAVIRDGFELRDASRAGERDTLADRIVERLLEAGLTTEQVRVSLADLESDEVLDRDAMVALEAAVESASARLENRAPRSAAQIRTADSLDAARRAAADSAALAAADTIAPADSARAAAADSIRALRARLAEADSALEDERTQRAAAEERLESGAIRWVLSSVTDELGLGLGWLGLYFTAFTVLGGGQTPGKRVFRLRVIRLDGRAIGWWTSLQRFGGYSASVFTGMLGFAEMLWDDNRQALQDKLVATVVVQEPKKSDAAATAPLDVVADQLAIEEEAQLTLADQPMTIEAARAQPPAEDRTDGRPQPDAEDDESGPPAIEPARND